MSGHSKWSTIKRKKGKTDAQRAKVFTKISREVSVAVREGGPDPATNAKLRDLIAKAKGLNVPNDNINRVINKAAGGEKDNYEAITYEGYGPGGVAVMVETLTDNRNRTAANLRHIFDKYGAGLGTSGSVAYMFSEKGTILIEGEGLDEEKLMEDCFDAGADDFEIEEGVCEITAPPANVYQVSGKLEEKGYTIATAEAEMVPANYVGLSGEENIKNITRMLDALEDDDDVQNVWHNLEDGVLE